MNDLINPLALGKVLKKYSLNLKNKQQVVLLSKRKTATWSAIHRLARKLKFKQSVVDRQQQNLVNKEERRKKFKSMTSQQRRELILEKMKAKGIGVGSGVPDKKYDSKEVYELIHIANCFTELREKGK